ncbi:dicarboxylate/amino acid:cation symporter [Sphingomonas arenae]|uniref:dicarboxylate/amino acid:cation symporter n=1 Tax=Sphingomonas arenae TaxID=2812555 RepID=UPI0019681B08|nr:cation:dicarboxylase symporter family transporter [Sphingomonas arenae]
MEGRESRKGGRNSALLVLGALVAGLLLGALVGASSPGWREPLVTAASLVGGLWLDALKMTVIPLIVALLVVGIVGGADAARAGGLATKAVLWFVGFYIFSALFGATMMPALLSLFPLPDSAAEALRAGLAGVDQSVTQAAVPGVADFFKSIVPTNVIGAAANDQILPLVFFTVIFAFALARVDLAKRANALGFFEAVSEAMLLVIGWVLWLAPIGVFALAFTVGAGAGGSALGAVAHYVVLISSLGLVLTALGWVIAVVVARYKAGEFTRAMAEPCAVAISTRSSLASLPAMLAAAARLGIDERKADVVLPMAVALFRATGPAMNIGVAFYVAHWMGVTVTPVGFAAGVAVAAMASIGAVSLPGQISFVTSIAPISLAMGVPIEPLALLIAVETIPDIFRTLGNVVLDVAVTGAVTRESPDVRTAEG